MSYPRHVSAFARQGCCPYASTIAARRDTRRAANADIGWRLNGCSIRFLCQGSPTASDGKAKWLSVFLGIFLGVRETQADNEVSVAELCC